MKFDGELPYCHSSVIAELELELKSHDDNKLNMLKIENETPWNGKDDLITVEGSTRGEVSSVCSSFKDEDSNKENLMDGNYGDDQHDSSANRMKLIQNKKESQSDRTVTQIKLPEIIVCFNDGAQQIVKDVCIDKSPRSHEETLLENNDANEHMKASTRNATADLGQRRDAIALILEDLNSSSFIKEGKDKNSSWDLSEFVEGAIAMNQVSTGTYGQEISLARLLTLEECGRGLQNVNSAITRLNDVSKQSDGEKNVEEAEIHEDSSTKTASPTDTFESKQGSQPKDIAKDDRSESTFLEGFAITADVISDAKAFKQGRETKEVFSHVEGEIINPGVDSVGSDKEEHNEDNNLTKEGASDGATASNGTSFYLSNYADRNLFGPSYLSDPQASSEHIAYSGSISLRSESSTTSTRSFAFPILQSEWNTSPVKMAEADRRCIGKHRRLRMVLFCCKF